MKETKSQKLERLGYRDTTTQEFLGLSDEEMALIDLKISLIQKLKALRSQRKMTQHQLAKLINSSQPRVAMMERGRPDISLDLICRALFALGVSRRELGKAIFPGKAA
jgi:DNA-binding XRE family transcriptional regulator